MTRRNTREAPEHGTVAGIHDSGQILGRAVDQDTDAGQAKEEKENHPDIVIHIIIGVQCQRPGQLDE